MCGLQVGGHDLPRWAALALRADFDCDGWLECPAVEDGIRIDKWLWAVRLFKTRALAAAACSGGHVKRGGKALKPASVIRPGDELVVIKPPRTHTLRVLALLERRIGAAKVPEYFEDLTPPEELAKRALPRAFASSPARARGAGRPTKKDQRALRRFFG